MMLTLPYPPSVNRYYRHVGCRTLISREGRSFRRHAVAILDGDGPRKPPMNGRIVLAMDAFPPDRRRRDLDNLQKAVLDALECAGIYEDDSQIDLLIARRREPVAGGKVVIHVDCLPLTCCPLCGGPFLEDN